MAPLHGVGLIRRGPRSLAPFFKLRIEARPGYKGPSLPAILISLRTSAGKSEVIVEPG